MPLNERATPWRRLSGPGMYPVEYAAWLLHPLRRLIAPPSRIIHRLHLVPTGRVLEVGCGPAFFSPTAARILARGHLVLLDAQPTMLGLAIERLKKVGLTNFTAISGLAEDLPFADNTFDVVFMVTVLGEVPDRASAVKEAARVLRSEGLFSVTEAAGDPDCVPFSELDALARAAGLELADRWHGILVKTSNYKKP
jgi:ubiquinone/menaquinone biosynthesis C-methylase UbiE